jgi:hypothetical protein
VTVDTYRTALDAAIREYEQLGDERRAIDRRLSELAQTIGTLSRLLGHVPTVPLGLTDACRLALKNGQAMTPLEVRDRLLAIGVNLSVYSNPLSAIHTVLKRLHLAGEVRHAHRTPNGRTYVWDGRSGMRASTDRPADASRQHSPSGTASARRRHKR